MSTVDALAVHDTAGLIPLGTIGSTEQANKRLAVRNWFGTCTVLLRGDDGCYSTTLLTRLRAVVGWVVAARAMRVCITVHSSIVQHESGLVGLLVNSSPWVTTKRYERMTNCYLPNSKLCTGHEVVVSNYHPQLHWWGCRWQLKLLADTSKDRLRI
jgi:hypothetical protein